MHHDIFVSKFSFRSHRTNRKRTIFEVIKRRLLLGTFCFEFRKRGLMLWTPVDSALAAIDKPIVIEFLKGAVDCFDDVGIEREFLARPVA